MSRVLFRGIGLALLALLLSVNVALADGLLVSPCGKTFCSNAHLKASPQPVGGGSNAGPPPIVACSGACPATTVNYNSATSTTQTASGTSISTQAITAAVGSLVFVQVGAYNAGPLGVSTIGTLSDPKGNTWNVVFESSSTGGAPNDGVSLKVFSSNITNALSATVLTINHTTTIGPRGTTAGVVTAAGPVAYSGIGTPVCSGGINPQTTGPFNVDNGATVLAFGTQHETNYNALDTDTTNGSWSSGTASCNACAGNGGSGTNSASLGFQYKQNVTASGNQQWDITKAATPRHCVNWVAVHG
jgi:hypothetical protein